MLYGCHKRIKDQMMNVKIYCLVSLLYLNILDNGKHGSTWFPGYFVQNISTTMLPNLFSFLFWVRKMVWKLKKKNPQKLCNFLYTYLSLYRNLLLFMFSIESWRLRWSSLFSGLNTGCSEKRLSEWVFLNENSKLKNSIKL